MHGTACDESGTPPLVRSAAALLAVTFGLLAGLVFTTQTTAHAAPLIGRAVVAVASVASAIPSNPTTGVGDVAYYGNGTVYAGSRDGAVSRSGMAQTKGGRYGALLGAVGTGLSLVVGWDFGLGADAAPLGYADPAPTGGNLAGKWGTTSGPGTSTDQCSSYMGYFQACASGSLAQYGSSGTATLTVAYQSLHRGQRAVPRCGSNGSAGAGPAVTSAGDTLPQSVTVDASACTGLGGVHHLEWWFKNGSGVWTDTTLRYFLGTSPVPPTGGGPAGTTSVTTTTASNCTGAGGAYTTAPSSISYTRNTTPLPPITVPACNGSDRRTGINQTSTTSDGRTVADPVGDLTTPIVPAGYSLCQTTACELQLVRLTPGFAGSPDSDPFICNGTTGCAGALDPQLSPRTGTTVKVATATATGTQTASETTWEGSEKRARTPEGREYECRYGPYRVGLNECAPVPHEYPSPPEAPESESNCNLSDFSLNPVSWVVVPLKCLFIPRDSVVQAQVGRVQTSWDATPPGVIGAAVGDLFAPFDTTHAAGSCEGPLFTFPLPLTSSTLDMHPFSACGDLLQFASTTFLTLQTIGIYLAALSVGVRTITRTVGLESPLQA